MGNLEGDIFPYKEIPQRLGNYHRPMSAAGAADGDSQIRLTLAAITGKKKRHHIQEFLQKNDGLGFLHDKVSDLRVKPAECFKFRDEMRVRQKSHIHHQIRFERYAEPVTERLQMHGHVPGALFALDTGYDQLFQLMDVKFRSIDYSGGKAA